MSQIVFGLIVVLGCYSARTVWAATGVRALDESAIAAKDPSHVTMIALARAGQRLVAVGLHGVIIYSNDCGRTWNQAAVPVSVELTAVSFASPTDGWAAGHYGVILHTIDGGKTWQLQLNGLQANKLTLAAAQAAVAANDPSPGTPLALKRANFFNAEGADKPFLTVWTRSAMEAIAFGAYRMAMSTQDGGKTWTDISLHVDDPYSHNLYGVAQAGANIIVVGEAGMVFRSSDGGRIFGGVTSPGQTTLFGVIATDDHAVLVFGVAGQAYKSQDGGATWQSIAGFDPSANLTSAAMLAGGEIVGGEDGVLYISHDHAQTFSPLPRRLPMAIYDIAQAADGSLVIAGSAGVLRVQLGDLH